MAGNRKSARISSYHEPRQEGLEVRTRKSGYDHHALGAVKRPRSQSHRVKLHRMYVPPKWTCERCATGNELTARFCTTCGQPNRQVHGSGRPERQWWKRKRVWLIAASGWIVAFVLFIALVVSLSFKTATTSLPSEDDLILRQIRASTDCDELFLWVWGGYSEGRLDIAIEANDRWTRIGCTFTP